MKTSSQVKLLILALFLALFAIRGIVSENRVRNDVVVPEKVRIQELTESTWVDSLETVEYAPEPEDAFSVEVPMFDLKTALSSGQPLALIFGLEDGYSVHTNWAAPALYSEKVSTSEVMSFDSGGIETRASEDGTLVTLVHSGYHYDQKLFAADLVKYFWKKTEKEPRTLAEAQKMVLGMVGMPVWLCQSTDGSIKPLDELSLEDGCPNQVEFQVSAAAIVVHDQVAGYEANFFGIQSWMAEYEVLSPENSLGFDKVEEGGWMISTCLNQLNDQVGDGSYSYEFNRLVLKLQRK